MLLASYALVAPVTIQADAASPWWARAALTGVAIDQVRADAVSVIVRTSAGATLRSADGGRTFTAVPGNPELTTVPEARTGGDTWRIDGGGAVLHARGTGLLAPDPGSPNLGAGAHLIAAPGTLQGVVVAVAHDGTVWRRGGDGGWGRALLLLPAGITLGVPRVTAVAAFNRPVTDTVYLSTDGYSVLLSTDGGDDWIRANPGLPDSVNGLAADSGNRLLYAATRDGLYVHRLQSLPAPPAYHDVALALRWVGLALVSLVAALLAVFALWRAVPPVRDAS